MVEGMGSRVDKAFLGAASEHLLFSISQMEMAVVLTDPSGDITYVNPHFTILTGYGRGEVLGESAQRLAVHGQDKSCLRDVKRQLNEKAQWHGRFSFHCRDGAENQARGTITTLRDHSGATCGYSAFFRQSREELKLEAQLRQVQKMEAIGEMAAGIAHEINTPIQYVGDNIQFLRDATTDMGRLVAAYEAVCVKARDGVVDATDLDAIDTLRTEIDWEFLQEEIPEAIAQALEGRNRVAEIVRAMKEFAHPGDETLTPIDVHHAIENTLAVSRGEWKYMADVKTEFAEDMPAVPCFPGSFNQVLLNLVVNAAHAIADTRGDGNTEKGCITISTCVRGTYGEVRVRDTGCGISTEHQERIFEPFFTTKDVGKGTGQGLALAHTVVVERMGGKIEVESSPGHGTTFILLLPLRVANEEKGEIE